MATITEKNIEKSVKDHRNAWEGKPRSAGWNTRVMHTVQNNNVSRIVTGVVQVVLWDDATVTRVKVLVNTHEQY